MSHRIHISTKLGKWAGLPRYQVGLDICIHALKNMFPKTCRTSCTLLNSPIDFSIGLQMSVSSFLWEFRIHLLLQARANSSSSYTGSCGVFEATSISTKELASTAVRNVLTHGSPWLTRHSRRGRLVVLSVKIAEKKWKNLAAVIQPLRRVTKWQMQRWPCTLTGHTTEVSPSSNIWSNWYPKFLNSAVQLVVTG